MRSGGLTYLPVVTSFTPQLFAAVKTGFWSIVHGKANVPPAEYASTQDARFPRTDGNEMGQSYTCSAPQEGQEAAYCSHSGQVRWGLTTSDRPFGFPRSRRITRGAELERVKREGRRIRTRYFDARIVFPSLRVQVLRIGLIVPRFKHSAVQRNKVKRQLRELIRLRLLPQILAGEIVIRTYPECYSASGQHLADAIEKVRVAVLQFMGEEKAQG